MGTEEKRGLVGLLRRAAAGMETPGDLGDREKVDLIEDLCSTADELDPDTKWNDDTIQFPRLIEEAQAAGAFTPEVIKTMADSMDLSVEQVQELMDRAQKKWDEIKADLT